MRCYECKWLDRSVILTSIPPQYGCTLGFGSHYADHECEYDFMPIVRCKDCRHRYYADNRVPHERTWVCERFANEEITDNDFCSWGERREIGG